MTTDNSRSEDPSLIVEDIVAGFRDEVRGANAQLPFNWLSDMFRMMAKTQWDVRDWRKNLEWHPCVRFCFCFCLCFVLSSCISSGVCLHGHAHTRSASSPDL